MMENAGECRNTHQIIITILICTIMTIVILIVFTLWREQKLACIFPPSPSDISCGVNFDMIVVVPVHDFKGENIVHRQTDRHTDRICDIECVGILIIGILIVTIDDSSCISMLKWWSTSKKHCNLWLRTSRGTLLLVGSHCDESFVDEDDSQF